MLPKRRCGLGGELVEGAVVVLVEEVREGKDGGGFSQHVTGGSNELAQGFGFECEQAGGGEGIGGFEVGDGAYYATPRGVLDEVSTEDGFKGRAGGPPMLRTVDGEQLLVEAAKPGGGISGGGYGGKIFGDGAGGLRGKAELRNGSGARRSQAGGRWSGRVARHGILNRVSFVPGEREGVSPWFFRGIEGWLVEES